MDIEDTVGERVRLYCRVELEDALTVCRVTRDRRELVNAVRLTLQQCVSSDLASEVIKELGFETLTLEDLYEEADHLLGQLLYDDQTAKIVNERPEDPADPKEFAERIASLIYDGAFDPYQIGLDPLHVDDSWKTVGELASDVLQIDAAWRVKPGARGTWMSRVLRRGAQAVVMEACAKRWSDYKGDPGYGGESFRRAFANWQAGRYHGRITRNRSRSRKMRS